MPPSILICDNTYPVLYSFRRCPYAMRARLAIATAQVRVELREIELRNKPESLLLASPKGTVPVLQLGSSEVIDESRDIMLWALQQHDPEHWLEKHWLNQFKSSRLFESVMTKYLPWKPDDPVLFFGQEQSPGFNSL
jgi:glutathione S-transferase